MRTIKVLYWNVYIGNSPEETLRELSVLAKAHRPHIIGLGEATKAYKITDEIPGYRRIHLAPVRQRGNENADSAVLVRHDVVITSKRIWRMRLSWFVPGRRVRHTPRVYIVVRFKAEGRKWRVAVGHWPFGAAQEETKRKVRRWFRLSTLPSAYVGDLNAREPELTRFFRPLKNIGFGVDRAIYKRCRATAKNLGKHGSDHPAVLFRFSRS